MSGNGQRDVVILGGGVAGMSLALQLKTQRPETTISVIEKRTHPVPETAFKVGESIAEIGTHYFKKTLGLTDHLESGHLRKMSLRIFSSAGDNSDISRRPEIGLHKFSPLRTHHIDRGLIENHLADLVSNAGVEMLGEESVTSFEPGPDRHTVESKRRGQRRELSARWVVDATGREGFLRRRLGLGVDIAHDVNAAWFRIPERLSVDEWSDDSHWRARVPSETRWMSTNQLVGEGYWIWLIPLPSGAMSVGLVADPRFVPFERIRRYDVLREWLAEHEPQLASKLPDSDEGLLDFRKLKKYAYGTRRGLSPQRWALVGEAGLFLDPLYSTGFDFIAVGNTLTARLIEDSFAGAPDLRRRLKAYNAYYLGQFLGWEPAFAGQYEVFRDAQATAAKVIWDNAQYFMFPVLMFTKDCITDPQFLAGVRRPLQQAFHMNVHMQRCFRELSAYDCDIRAAGFPVASDPVVGELFDSVLSEMDTAEVSVRIERNVRALHALGRELLERLYAGCGRPVPQLEGDLPPAHSDIPLLDWVSYEQRTGEPALVAAQSAESWMLR